MWLEKETLVFVLTEFQSRVDHTMAHRMYDYVNEIFRWWWNAHPDATVRPLILPVVLFVGEGEWFAQKSFRAIQVPCEGLIREL